MQGGDKVVMAVQTSALIINDEVIFFDAPDDNSTIDPQSLADPDEVEDSQSVPGLIPLTQLINDDPQDDDDSICLFNKPSVDLVVEDLAQLVMNDIMTVPVCKSTHVQCKLQSYPLIFPSQTGIGCISPVLLSILSLSQLVQLDKSSSTLIVLAVIQCPSCPCMHAPPPPMGICSMVHMRDAMIKCTLQEGDQDTD